MSNALAFPVSESDWGLAGLAAVLCVFTNAVSLMALSRALASQERTRIAWVAMIGVGSGTGVWATYLIVRLGYGPWAATGYRVESVAMSLAVGVAAAALGFGALLVWRSRLAALLGGTFVGTGIAVTYHLSMWSPESDARLQALGSILTCAVLLNILLSWAALHVTVFRSGPKAIGFASVSLTLAMLLQHVITVAAIGMEAHLPALPVGLSRSTTSAAVTIACAAMVILAVCFAATVEDRRRGNSNRKMDDRMPVQGVAHYAAFTLDPMGKVLNWNAGAQRATGYAESEIVGVHVSCLYRDQEQAMAEPQRELDIALKNGILECEGLRMRKDGTPFLAQVIIYPIRGEHGNFIGFATILRDITQQKQDAEKFAYLARRDFLTGLPNRGALKEHLDRTLKTAAAKNRQFAVLCMDLNRFKEVNDSFGHPIGDSLLCEAARRFAVLYEGSFLARVGGDEFVVVVDEDSLFTRIVVERMSLEFNGAFNIKGNELQVGASTGLAVYPVDGTDGVTLMRNADAALYRAKEERHGKIQFYDWGMAKGLRERRALIRDLRKGMEQGEFILHYQPQARVDGEIIGFEALLRWRHPSRGFVSPSDFITAAEEGGLILKLGEWVLREACSEAASWPAGLRVAVNLSPVQFRHGDLAGLVHSVLLTTGLPAARLELEITEGVLVDDLSRAISVLGRIKVLGVRIAMDDFGTGYSSLSNLQAFPFDKIKIDRSFVSNLDVKPQSATIVRAVLGLGRALGLSVIAEGVETAEQLAFLSKQRCQEVQGYLIGGPLPIEDYAHLVGRSSKKVQEIAS
jgi:diguanylate cyclase (GGDEF)-like protein/PAS domain S-box-containing protein